MANFTKLLRDRFATPLVPETTVAARLYLAATSVLARATGLEPATTGSTVRYSNQLSYAPQGDAKQQLY
jgi:hypothetical protein